jgi:hypothetical protein
LLESEPDVCEELLCEAVGLRAHWSYSWPSSCPSRDCISRQYSSLSRSHWRIRTHPTRSCRCLSRQLCYRVANRARWWYWYLSSCPY